MPQTLDSLDTPCLLLDRVRMEANLTRLRARLQVLGVSLRPHLKTCKSVEIARLVMASPAGPATVSTLREAEEFAAAGVRDMIYAIGIAPAKLARVQALRRRGVDLAVILDSPEQARAVAQAGPDLPALIEIDSDGHRAGVRPSETAQLLAIAGILGKSLRGVLTHAGGSYDAQGEAAMVQAAEAERAAAVAAAQTLRAAGFACPVVSVGSTPTAHVARDLSGVTEVRAGVYVFFDLMMAKLGVCSLDDIAISVLTTVIGHRPDLGWTLTDGGWMALSRDQGAGGDFGYGLVCNLAGQPIEGLIVSACSQEHGVLAAAPGTNPASLPQLPLGTRVRILPHHACATAAQFDRYHVLAPQAAGQSCVEAEWTRFSGW